MMVVDKLESYGQWDPQVDSHEEPGSLFPLVLPLSLCGSKLFHQTYGITHS